MDIGKDIAIIGVSAQIAGTSNLNSFWELLLNEQHAITDYPAARKEDYLSFWNAQRNRGELNYVQGGYLNKIDGFDSSFFGINPREAMLMDPHQRLFLQTAVEAIEDAGYGGSTLSASRTGVYIGHSSDFGIDYKRYIEEIRPEFLPLSIVGNIKSIMAGRISKLLNLRGPSVLIDTACSSSLVALHFACKAIQRGEIDYAIVGGVKLNLLPLFDNMAKQVGIQSSDGITRAFDEKADGTVFGEGRIAILIKSAKQARQDKDHIYAWVKGSAINQDGQSAGITAPNTKAQEEVIVQAWKDAEIDPLRISYVEAHGTGTKVGDSIEVQALQQAFATVNAGQGHCAIGSVKTNVGHLDHLAGLAGVIKVVLSMKNKTLPASLNYDSPNKYIRFHNSSVHVNNRTRDWESNGARVSGVSSFGISGTNCHVIVEENDEEVIANLQSMSKDYIVTISAKTIEGVRTLISEYINVLSSHQVYDIRDLSYTTTVGRGHYNCRLAVIAGSRDELLNKLGSIRELDIPFERNGMYYNNEVSSVYESNLDYQSLRDVCVQYVSGREIEWVQIYSTAGDSYHRISLPAYPFSKERCWVEGKEEKSVPDGVTSVVKWQNRELVLNNLTHRKMLMICHERHDCQQLISMLDSQRIEVTQVRVGLNSIQYGQDRYINSEQEWKILLEKVDISSFSQVVVLGYANGMNMEDVEEELSAGLFTLLNVVKGVSKRDDPRKLILTIITNQVYKVTGKEQINPLQSMVHGMGRVINLESGNIVCRVLDIDNRSYELAVEHLGSTPTLECIALREGYNYVPTIVPVLPGRNKTSISLSSEGAYVITGGTGAIGLEIAKCLAEEARVNLVLLSRSAPPPRDEWERLLNSNDISANIRMLIRSVMEIEGSGSRVSLLTGDVCDRGRMEEVFDDIRQRFNKINGVFHLAGLTDNGLLHTKTEESLCRVIGPKVYGTMVLDQITNHDSLDFFVLSSSISSITGDIGIGDYAAANCFLDSFSRYRNTQGKKTVCINWGAWEEKGMAVKNKVDFDKLKFKPIPTSTAIAAFKKLLVSNEPQVIVGVPKDEINRCNELPDSSLLELQDHDGNSGELSLNRITQIITDIWEEVLGITGIDHTTDLYEMGGDSVTAIQIHDNINNNKSLSCRIVDIYEHSNIKSLSEHIYSKVRK